MHQGLNGTRDTGRNSGHGTRGGKRDTGHGTRDEIRDAGHGTEKDYGQGWEKYEKYLVPLHR